MYLFVWKSIFSMDRVDRIRYDPFLVYSKIAAEFPAFGCSCCGYDQYGPAVLTEYIRL
jgi:hypothetical protein